jgi:hypothetical protein
MESLSPEDKAIYETVSASNDKFKADMNAMILATVNTAVESAVEAAMERAVDHATDKAVATVGTAERNMQVYVDGVEEDLRTAMGLASHDVDPDPHTRHPGGDAEVGQNGHHAATTTRGMGAGARPYVPPPARGIHPNSAFGSAIPAASAFGSLLHHEGGTLTLIMASRPTWISPNSRVKIRSSG